MFVKYLHYILDLKRRDRENTRN